MCHLDQLSAVKARSTPRSLDASILAPDGALAILARRRQEALEGTVSTIASRREARRRWKTNGGFWVIEPDGVRFSIRTNHLMPKRLRNVSRQILGPSTLSRKTPRNNEERKEKEEKFAYSNPFVYDVIPKAIQ